VSSLLILKLTYSSKFQLLQKTQLRGFTPFGSHRPTTWLFAAIQLSKVTSHSGRSIPPLRTEVWPAATPHVRELIFCFAFSLPPPRRARRRSRCVPTAHVCILSTSSVATSPSPSAASSPPRAAELPQNLSLLTHSRLLHKSHTSRDFSRLRMFSALAGITRASSTPAFPMSTCRWRRLPHQHPLATLQSMETCRMATCTLHIFSAFEHVDFECAFGSLVPALSWPPFSKISLLPTLRSTSNSLISMPHSPNFWAVFSSCSSEEPA
jgi:hypothetical protein